MFIHKEKLQHTYTKILNIFNRHISKYYYFIILIFYSFKNSILVTLCESHVVYISYNKIVT